MKTKKTTYSAVVESRSSSVDYQRWDEQVNCGHRHKTIATAQQCLDAKRRLVCEHGRYAGLPCRHCLGGSAHGKSCSATWYNGSIHNHNEERV